MTEAGCSPNGPQIDDDQALERQRFMYAASERKPLPPMTTAKRKAISSPQQPLPMGFLPLSSKVAIHSRTGIVVELPKRRIADPVTGYFINRNNSMAIELYKAHRLPYYFITKWSFHPTNWVFLNDEEQVSEISQLAAVVDLKMCSECFLVCWEKREKRHGCRENRFIRCKGFTGRSEPASLGHVVVTEVPRLEGIEKESLDKLVEGQQMILHNPTETVKEEEKLWKDSLKSTWLEKINQRRDLAKEQYREKRSQIWDPNEGNNGKKSKGSHDQNSTTERVLAEETDNSTLLTSGNEKEPIGFGTAENTSLQSNTQIESTKEKADTVLESVVVVRHGVASNNDTQSHILRAPKNTTAQHDDHTLVFELDDPHEFMEETDGVSIELACDEESSVPVTAFDSMSRALISFIDEMSAEDSLELVGAEPNVDLQPILQEYLTDPEISTTILPYLLLRCIVDDLWAAKPSIAETYRFRLDGKNMKLTLFDPDHKFPLGLQLRNEGGEKGWNVLISLEARPNDPSLFKKEAKLKTEGLSFESLCQILVVFRALVFTVISRIGENHQLLDTSSRSAFLEHSFDLMPCTTDQALLIVNESLHKHIVKEKRWPF